MFQRFVQYFDWDKVGIVTTTENIMQLTANAIKVSQVNILDKIICLMQYLFHSNVFVTANVPGSLTTLDILQALL